jgi:hypothetical protein
VLGIALTLAACATPQVPINRHARVSRHNVKLTEFDEERPLQVGNGEFAFGMGIIALHWKVPGRAE